MELRRRLGGRGPQVPDAQCQVQGDRRTWAEFDRRANGVAAALLDAGAQEQDKVAQYLYNGPEYLESMFAAFKAGLVPINTNYRYLDDELVYLWDNADVVAVVFHGTFADASSGSATGCPGPALALGRRRHRPCPDWATPTRRPPPAPTSRCRAVGPRRRPPAAALHRRHHRHAQGRDVAPGRPVPHLVGTLNPAVQGGDPDLRRRGRSSRRARRPARLPADARHRLVHAADRAVDGGRHGHPREPHSTSRSCSTTIERESVNTIAIVGDAFAKPMLPPSTPRPASRTSRASWSSEPRA